MARVFNWIRRCACRWNAPLEYIGSDEYVEATPKNLRLRKKILDETQRKRATQSRRRRQSRREAAEG